VPGGGLSKDGNPLGRVQARVLSARCGFYPDCSDACLSKGCWLCIGTEKSTSGDLAGLIRTERLFGCIFGPAALKEKWVVYAKPPLRWPRGCAGLSQPLHATASPYRNSRSLARCQHGCVPMKDYRIQRMRERQKVMRLATPRVHPPLPDPCAPDTCPSLRPLRIAGKLENRRPNIAKAARYLRGRTDQPKIPPTAEIIPLTTPPNHARCGGQCAFIGTSAGAKATATRAPTTKAERMTESPSKKMHNYPCSPQLQPHQGGVFSAPNDQIWLKTARVHRYQQPKIMPLVAFGTTSNAFDKYAQAPQTNLTAARTFPISHTQHPTALLLERLSTRRQGQSRAQTRAMARIEKTFIERPFTTAFPKNHRF